MWLVLSGYLLISVGIGFIKTGRWIATGAVLIQYGMLVAVIGWQA